MKKQPFVSVLCLFLCLVLLPWGPGGLAEEEEEFWYEPSEVFTGVVGRIAYALPGRPMRLTDSDAEGAWRDSWQLYCKCARHGDAEFQLHTADITPWIDTIMENKMAFSRAEAALQAMADYCSIAVTVRNGEISNVNSKWSNGFAYLTFDFGFPDCPDLEYTAKAVFDGTYIVALLGTRCAHTDRILSLLAPATEAQLVPPQPETVDFKGLSVTVTDRFQLIEDPDLSVLMCFTDDCTFLTGRYSPMDLTDQVARIHPTGDALKLIAGYEIEPVGCTDVRDGVVSSLGSLAWQYDFKTDLDRVFGEGLTVPYIGRLYVTPLGYWTLLAEDNDTGRAFIASAEGLWEPDTTPPKPASMIETLKDPVSGELPGTAFSGKTNHIFDDIKKDFDDFTSAVLSNVDLTLPATLGEFLVAMDVMYCGDNGSHFILSDPFVSDGSWFRLLSPLEQDDLWCFLTLSSDDEDACINSLDVVWSTGLADQEAFYRFATCCAHAVTFDTSLFPTPESIFAPEDTDSCSYSFQYSRYETDDKFSKFTMTALKPVEVTGVDLSPRLGLEDAMPPIPLSSAVTLEQFYRNWKDLNESFYGGIMPLTVIANGLELGLDASIWHMQVNESVFVNVYTETVDTTPYVTQVVVGNLSDDIFPVQSCGSLALAAASSMTEKQYIALLTLPLKYLNPEDMATVWPFAASNDAMLYLTYESSDVANYLLYQVCGMQ